MDITIHCGPGIPTTITGAEAAEGGLCMMGALSSRAGDTQSAPAAPEHRHAAPSLAILRQLRAHRFNPVQLLPPGAHPGQQGYPVQPVPAAGPPVHRRMGTAAAVVDESVENVLCILTETRLCN